jgi:glucokinase
MDLAAGKLLKPPNLPGWDDLPIRDLLAAQLGKPTVLQNDANAAAYGEFWAGAGRGSESLVMLTLGTGIGCGIIDHGRIVEGRHSHGAECGHVVIQMENARRAAAAASATWSLRLGHRAGQEGRRGPGPRRGDGPAPAPGRGQPDGPRHRRGRRGRRPLARRLMRETARYLAVGAVNLMHTIDPDIVLFGGGMIAAGAKFLADIRADIRSMALPIPAARTRVEFAALGGDAGFIGAAGCARMGVPTG